MLRKLLRFMKNMQINLIHSILSMECEDERKKVGSLIKSQQERGEYAVKIQTENIHGDK